MTLIKSISGIRGTIGGKTGDGLTPFDIVKFTIAFAQLMKEKQPGKKLRFIVGRDARISGQMVESLVIGTLSGMGVDVINAGLSTTPTVEMAVILNKANGGIILTASHNPKEWNALKLLNQKGEFISEEDGRRLIGLAENTDVEFAEIGQIGTITEDDSFINQHIESILNLNYVDKDIVRAANFTIVVDAVNSTGGIAIPALLKSLGVKNIIKMYCEPNGHFPHNPEPLPENLVEISKLVVEKKADLGIVVDPDVDRLAFVMENGKMFGEEYTLVAVADYVLDYKMGNTVSNLSSTKALRDITENAGGSYFASAVGEVNVVEKMKEVKAAIGGEGNGGIIFPQLHFGRDAMVGVALFLTMLAKKKMKISQLRAIYPDYYISKNKLELKTGIKVQDLFDKIKWHYRNQPILDIDGVKVEFPDGWVHIRSSNTEPILRVYAECTSPEKAQQYADDAIKLLTE